MKNICVLMSTYNGEKFLEEQLDSILKQKGVELRVIVRDDGSQDSTLDILEKYVARKEIEIADSISGSHWKTGVGGSFFLLLRYAVENYSEAEYFAFADQDDVWKEDKLLKAVSLLQGDRLKKQLYFSKKTIVDESVNEICKDSISFENSLCDFLVPNEASGCTMVINRCYAEYILRGGVEYYPYIHDVTLLKLAVCSDTKIFYDQAETMFYRQHTDNVVGFKRKLFFSFENIAKIFGKRKHYLSRLATDFINDYEITEEAEALLDRIANIKIFKNKVFVCKYFISNSKRNAKYKMRLVLTVLLNGI